MTSIADAARLQRARWASRTHFFASGFVFATWGVHVPTVKAHYGLDDAQLGIAILAAGTGALLGVLRASRLITRFGLPRAAGASGAIYALLLVALLAMPGLPALLGLMLCFGLLTSLFDVAINAEAAQLELLHGAPLMSGMHAMFSLGGMAGALSGSAALAAGWRPTWHLALVAVLGSITIALAATRMLARTPAPDADAAPLARLPRGPLLLLGALAAMGLVAEGAMYDWSVLYLQQELGSPQQQAALAYASFSAAMAAARFGGDAMRKRFAPAPLLRASALVAAASMTLVLLTHSPMVALLGCAGVGIGYANVIPVLFSAAARVPGVAPARGIAAVSAAGYLAFMAGPPLIGFLAQAISLTLALGVVVLFALALALLAPRTARIGEG